MREPTRRLVTALAGGVALTLAAGWAANAASLDRDRGQEATSSLIGLDPDALLRSFGPPERIAALTGEMQWWLWTEPDGATRQVRLYLDRVVHAEPDGASPEARDVPPETPYIGQPVAAIIAELGAPDAAGVRAVTATPLGREVVHNDSALFYDERVFVLHRGRLVANHAKVEPRYSGPR